MPRSWTPGVDVRCVRRVVGEGVVVVAERSKSVARVARVDVLPVFQAAVPPEGEGPSVGVG